MTRKHGTTTTVLAVLGISPTPPRLTGSVTR